MKYIPPANKEEKLFVSRVSDIMRQTKARHCARFSSFMNLREKSLAMNTILQDKSINTVFFGGNSHCERVMLGVSEDEIFEYDFPITRLDFEFKGEISHRDVLGAVTGLGIDREKTGDIFVSDGAFCIFVCDDIANFISENLCDVGREKVRFISQGLDIEFRHSYEERTDTVASARLDNIVAAVANVSRTKATEIISRGNAVVNHLEVTKADFEVEEGDVLSVKGSGRFIVDGLSEFSRKGRIIFKYRKSK